MRLMISVVATLMLASVTQADDNVSQKAQASIETSKPVMISSPKLQQAQEVSTTQNPSETALGEGNLRLVQYSRTVPARQQVYHSPAPRQSPTVIGRLVELEQRKNAWLRRTFLGR